jgi:signal transduction histidine kinase
MNNLTSQLVSATAIRQTNPAHALKIFKEILDSSVSSKDIINSVNARFNIAITYLILGNYSESLKNFNECLASVHSSEDKKLKSEILRGIGSNHFRLYNYREAIKYYYLSEQASIESGDRENLHLLYQGYGSVYNRLKLYNKSLEYALKSLDIAKQSGIKELLQASLMSIGACYYQLGNHKDAVKYLKESLELSSNNFAEANAYHFLSAMEFSKNNFTEARRLALKQIEISSRNNYYEFEALGLRLLGDIAFKETEYHESLNYFNIANSILDKCGEKLIRFSITKRIIDIYEITGDKDNTITLYKWLYKNHINHLENNIQLKIEQIDAEFETEKIKKEIEIEKESNQKLSTALEEVNELNRVLNVLHEEKNSLMHIVVHDLRNPVQSILSSARLINQNKDKTDYINELTDNINGQAKRMINLINRLLNYSSIEDGKIKLNITTFHSQEIFTRLINTLGAFALNKKIKIIDESSAQNYTVRTDFELLYQVLENLLTNAIKFSPEGKNIYFRFGKLLGNFTIEIQDEGPGFTDEDKVKLYSNFAKLSARPTGNEESTGLGLSIIKKLCDILGAEIKLESEFNKGAKFTITIKEK